MAAGGIRDRVRAQMRQEVKEAALRQLAEGGPGALSINAIAKELGVSGPALYRYFTGREALLTELILDAHADLTAALTAADGLPELAAAYRFWATSHPHRYRLLFGALRSDSLAEAARRTMAALGAAAVWSRLHGFASLEIEGTFQALGLDPEHVFAAEVEALSSAR